MTGAAGAGSIADPGHHNEKRQKAKAIEALRVTGSQVLAATAAQVSREGLNNWRKTDDEFQHAWDVAIQAYIAELKRVPIEERPHYWHTDIPGDVLTAREQALVYASQGYSFAGIAARLRMSPGRLKRWMEDDVDFKVAMSEAREAGNDFLEDEARRRGVDGISRPVFFQGQHIADVVEYSDNLLDRLLRSRRAQWRSQMVLEQSSDGKDVLEIHWKEPEPPAITHNPAPSNGHKPNGTGGE